MQQHLHCCKSLVFAYKDLNPYPRRFETITNLYIMLKYVVYVENKKLAVCPNMSSIHAYA